MKFRDNKQNSWTYSYVEVSGHNLLRLWVSLMNFISHKEGVWFSSFLLYSNCKRLCEFEEIEISSKVVSMTVNNKKENSLDFCLNFVQEFGLRVTVNSKEENSWDFCLDFVREFSLSTLINVRRAVIQRRGSKLAWIIILSVYGANNCNWSPFPFLRWSLDLWNNSLGF